MRRVQVLAAALFIWLGAQALAINVGDPAHSDQLPAELKTLYQKGERNFTINPGVYVFPAKKRDTFVFGEWRDAKISADGAVMIFDETHGRPIVFFRCENVLFRGATLRYSTHSCSQGRVLTCGVDADGSFVNWKIDAGYPSDIDKLGKTLNLIDHTTRKLRAGYADIGFRTISQISPGVFRLGFGKRPVEFPANDWLVCRYPGGNQIIHLDQSHNVTVQDVVCQNGGFGTFFETGGGSNHLIHCQITLGPKPTGATEEPVVSCGADGFHSVDTTIGPEVRDCIFEGVFLDDCIAIHGSFQNVLSPGTGNVVLIDGHKGHGGFAVGEPVRFSSEHGFFAEATCTALRTLPGEDRTVELTLDRELNVPAKAKANNPNRCGQGYRIINCKLGDTRSRGILVKADDGVIDHCLIEGCVMSGVSIGPEYWWNEANYCKNVVVSNNAIRYCNKHGTNHGAVFVHGDGAIGNSNITIENNVIESGACENVFNLQWADGINIVGNEFINADQQILKTSLNMIWLTHCRNITLRGNTVKNLGQYPGSLLSPGPDVTNIIDDHGLSQVKP